VPARGEAPARLSRMLLHAMLLRYTSNIKVEEGMEKRATWANSMRNRERERERERERLREREGEKKRKVEWSEGGGAHRDERGRERERGEQEERRRRWDHATIMYTRRVINICFRSPPPAAVIRKRGSPRNELGSLMRTLRADWFYERTILAHASRNRARERTTRSLWILA